MFGNMYSTSLGLHIIVIITSIDLSQEMFAINILKPLKSSLKPALQVCSAMVTTRVYQNTGGALLEVPIRTPMHGKSRVSSAISVCDN